MLHVKCNRRKEEVQKQSPRHFSAAYSMLNCGITEIAKSLATKRFILHQRSARAGFQQAQTFFPSPVLFLGFFFSPPPSPFVNTKRKTPTVSENYSPCPECTSPLIKSARPKKKKPTTHQAKRTANLFLPSPYHLSAAIIPHPWGKDPICEFQKPPQ